MYNNVKVPNKTKKQNLLQLKLKSNMKMWKL